MVVPVTEQTLLILASLALGDRHGYGIAQDVEDLTGGRMRLTAGTIYGALSRLTKDGLVSPSGEREVQGRRRRYYRLTPEGHDVLNVEVARLSATAATLSARLSPRSAPGLA
jgi:DNA-binding PadR family transcriptional regulator